MNNFKIFDLKNKCWFNPANSFINSDGVLVHAIPQTTGNYYKMGELGPNEKLIIVRSTGINDKNGVELYDGDKLKSGHTIVNFEGVWCGTKYGSAGTRLGMKPLDNMEKTGSKYEENK